jgi:hypothetical protein
MAEAADMNTSMLREIGKRFDGVDSRLDWVDCRLAALETAQASYKQALTADTLLSRLLTGEFEGRIEERERRARELEGHS